MSSEVETRALIRPLLVAISLGMSARLLGGYLRNDGGTAPSLGMKLHRASVP